MKIRVPVKRVVDYTRALQALEPAFHRRMASCRGG